MTTKVYIYIFQNPESCRFPKPRKDYDAVVYSHKSGAKIDLNTFKLFSSADDPKMQHLAATTSPLMLWQQFDKSKGNKWV